MSHGSRVACSRQISSWPSFAAQVATTTLSSSIPNLPWRLLLLNQCRGVPQTLSVADRHMVADLTICTSAFTCRGHFVASGGSGGELRVWDLTSRYDLAARVGHAQGHSIAAVSQLMKLWQPQVIIQSYGDEAIDCPNTPYPFGFCLLANSVSGSHMGCHEAYSQLLQRRSSSWHHAVACTEHTSMDILQIICVQPALVPPTCRKQS